MSYEKPKIAFFGHFGCTNLGNESTLLAILHNLRRLLPDAEFGCICTGPEDVAKAYGITTVRSRTLVAKRRELQNPLARWAQKLFIGIPIELYRWFKDLSTLRGTDALIVAGTGLLTDAYTLFDWGPYEVFRWAVIAKLCRCKLFFLSVGAGPIYSSAGRFFVKRALYLADFRSYRDESTQKYLKLIGFPAENDPVFPDLVFSLPESVVPRGNGNRARRPVVGLGVMLHAGKYSVERPTEAIQAYYLETLVELAKWLLAHEYNIRLLIGDLVDSPVLRDFKSLLKDRGVTYEGERLIDEPIASIEDLLSQLATTDFVVATRFHNILLSVLLNKPVIAISFHHKCASLMSQMGLAQYCQDINNLKADKLTEQFCRLQLHASYVKETMRTKVVAFQDALDKQYQTIFTEMFPNKQIAIQHAIARENLGSNLRR